MDVFVDQSLAKGIRKSEMLDAYFSTDATPFVDRYLPIGLAAERWTKEVLLNGGSLTPNQTKAVRRVVVAALAQNLNKGSDFLYHLGYNTISRKRSSEEFVMAARPRQHEGFFYRDILHLFFNGRNFTGTCRPDVFDLSVHFFDRYLERSSETEVGQRNCIRAYEELVDMRGLFVFLCHFAPAIATGGMRIPFRDGLMAATFEGVGPMAWRIGYVDYKLVVDEAFAPYVPPFMRGKDGAFRTRIRTFIGKKVMSGAKAAFIEEFSSFVERYKEPLGNLAVFSGMFYPSFDDPAVAQVIEDAGVYDQMASDFRWMMCRDERNSQVFCKQRGIDFRGLPSFTEKIAMLKREQRAELNALRGTDRGTERNFWSVRGCDLRPSPLFTSSPWPDPMMMREIEEAASAPRFAPW